MSWARLHGAMNTLRHGFSAFLLASAFWLCRLLYKVEIVGDANIPRQGPFLFVVTHFSKLDTGFLLYNSLLRKRRPDAYVYGGVGLPWPLRPPQTTWGIPVPRGVGRAGPSLWTALKVLQKGCPLLIAPEGYVSWDGRLQPLEPGAAWLALRTRVPLVVCVLKGGYAVWPRWAKMPRLTGRLEIRIGEPFILSDVYDRKINEATIQAVNRRIVDHISTLMR